MKTWKLKRTAQCEKCPWRKGVDPREIPNGYSLEKHRALRSTIATSASCNLPGQELVSMACHETEDAHCIGWLMNQLGPGNNIPLRLRMRNCANAAKIRLRGDQHQTFDETLPECEDG